MPMDKKTIEKLGKIVKYGNFAYYAIRIVIAPVIIVVSITAGFYFGHDFLRKQEEKYFGVEKQYIARIDDLSKRLSEVTMDSPIYLIELEQVLIAFDRYLQFFEDEKKRKKTPDEWFFEWMRGQRRGIQWIKFEKEYIKYNLEYNLKQMR